MLRRVLIVMAALLVVGPLGLIGTGGADAAPALGKPYCTKWTRTGNGASVYRYCATFTKKKTAFSTTDQFQLHNTDAKKSVPLNCDVRKSHTWSQSGTVSVKAEAGVIFAKAETEVSGTLAHSTSSEVGSGTVYKVAPKSWGHCRYGSSELTVWGTAYEQINNGKLTKSKVHTFKTTFPAVATWEVGPGQL